MVALFGDAINPDDWKLSYTSAKSGVLTATGTNSGFGLDFNISSTRNPKVTVACDKKFYSLPDAFQMVVNPGTTNIKSITLRFKPANVDRYSDVTITPTLTPSADNTIKVDMSQFGDNSDIAFYPVVFQSIAFSLGGSTGKYHIDVPSMHAVYNNFTEGVANIATDNALNGDERYFTIEGIEVPANALAPGLYIKVNGSKAQKIVIK